MAVKKTVIKEEIEMFGIKEGKDACGGCINVDKKITSTIPKSEIPIEYKDYNVLTTDKGKAVAKEKNIEDIPYVEYCKIAEDNTKKCDTVIGFDEKDWVNLGKKREEEFE